MKRATFTIAFFCLLILGFSVLYVPWKAELPAGHGAATGRVAYKGHAWLWHPPVPGENAPAALPADFFERSSHSDPLAEYLRVDWPALFVQCLAVLLFSVALISATHYVQTPRKS